MLAQDELDNLVRPDDQAHGGRPITDRDSGGGSLTYPDGKAPFGAIGW